MPKTKSPGGYSRRRRRLLRAKSDRPGERRRLVQRVRLFSYTDQLRPVSETQTEPETDAGPTPFASAPWEPEPPEREDGIAHAHVWGSDGDLVATVCDNPVYGETAEDRARLIAAAGTAAQEAKEMGYDPQKAVEALPTGLERVRRAIVDLLDGPPENTSEPAIGSAVQRMLSFLEDASGIDASEIVDDGYLQDALDRAEGSDQ